MADMETSIEINRPVASVFRFLLGLDAMCSPRPQGSLSQTTEGPVGAGTTYLIRQPVFGRIRENGRA
jgi:hypothetical protein